MASSCASQTQRKTRSMAAMESEGNGPDDIEKALQQLHTDKKTPVFLKTLINHILHLQDSLSTVLEENRKLHEEVSSLHNENSNLKRALADAEHKLASSARVHESSFSNMTNNFGEKERLRCDRGHKKGGGVLILIRRTIAFETIWRESIPEAYEILSCDLKLLESTIRISGIYRTPSCNLNNTIQLTKVLNDLSSCEGLHVISGDFNLSDINWFSPNPAGITLGSKYFIEMCRSCNLKQHVRAPTRGGHVLDL
ncbi:hypothetical protein ANCDUO_04544, partial [Ancylostoma duodenale]